MTALDLLQILPGRELLAEWSRLVLLLLALSHLIEDRP